MNLWATYAESEMLSCSRNRHSHMTVLPTLGAYRISRTVDVSDMWYADNDVQAVACNISCCPERVTELQRRHPKMWHFYWRCRKLSRTTRSQTSDTKSCVFKIYQFSLRYKGRDRILIHWLQILTSYFLIHSHSVAFRIWREFCSRMRCRISLDSGRISLFSLRDGEIPISVEKKKINLCGV